MIIYNFLARILDCKIYKDYYNNYYNDNSVSRTICKKL